MTIKLTREEAIQDLKAIKSFERYARGRLALDIAIEALQTPPISQRSMYQAGYKQAQEDRPKGEWVYHRNELSCVRWSKWECTACHKRQENKSNFCPNCGADMRGETDED